MKKESGGANKKKPMTLKELLKAPGVALVLGIYAFNTMIALAFTAINPVFWFTSPGLGGYGLSPAQMSVFLAVGGLSQALWTLFVFPPWQRKVGTGGILHVLYILYPIGLVAIILPSVLLRTGHETAFYVVAYIFNIGFSSIAMTFSKSMPD